MSMNYLLLIALYYVFVQCALLFNLSGAWRVAAFLPIPLISLAMCVSVVPGILDPIVSTLLTMFAVPIGTAYLLVIALAWVLRTRSSALWTHRRMSAP